MPDDPIDETLDPRPIHEMSDREILVLMCERQRVNNLRQNATHETLLKHEDRIKALENWRNGLAGAWAASMFWLFGVGHK